MKLQKLLSYVRRAVDDYHMIEEGDKIAVFEEPEEKASSDKKADKKADKAEKKADKKAVKAEKKGDK